MKKSTQARQASTWQKVISVVVSFAFVATFAFPASAVAALASSDEGSEQQTSAVAQSQDAQAAQAAQDAEDKGLGDIAPSADVVEAEKAEADASEAEAQAAGEALEEELDQARENAEAVASTAAVKSVKRSALKALGAQDVKGADQLPIESLAAIQSAINDAEAGTEQTVRITNSFFVDASHGTVVVPAGKQIVLTADDAVKIECSSSDFNLMFRVEKGAKLTLGKNLTLNGGYWCALVDSAGEVVLDGAKLRQAKNYAVRVNGNGASFTSNAGEIAYTESQTSYGALTISNGATATIEDISITNNSVNSSASAAVLVRGASAVMNGGTIANNKNREQGFFGAGGICVYTGSGTTEFTMNGGTVENNSAYSGAGVLVYGSNAQVNPSYFTMNGGTIANNSASYAGGGVFVLYGGTFTLNDGSISKNTSCYDGGGVATMDGYWSSGKSYDTERDHPAHLEYSKRNPAAFIMNGGEVVDNDCYGTWGYSGAGGGIYVCSLGVDLKAGLIARNHAGTEGGGIYVSTVPYVLHLHSALVTGNHATSVGGGIWLCPTGSGKHDITDASAIFDNSSDGAGDDIVSTTSGWFAGNPISIANKMLGGWLVDWYRDGKLKTVYSEYGGYPDTSASRYSTESVEEHEQLGGVISNYKYNVALKAVASDEAKQAARSEARLVITDNKSPRGGGIGANAQVVFGQTNREYQMIDINVEKKWDNGPNEQPTNPVTVYLLEDGKRISEATLTEGNDWSHAFVDLPKCHIDANGAEGAQIKYSVEEAPYTGYVASYDVAQDAETGNYTYTITNTYETVDLSIEKKWNDVDDADGIRPQEVQVTLSADGTELEKVTLNAANNWTRSFDKLPKYTSAGTEVVYTVSEADVEGYKSAVNEDSGAFIVTNTHTPKTAVSVQKEWNDYGNDDGIRPESIEIALTADGKQIDKATLDAAGGWACEFKDLVKYDGDGNAIKYGIVETAVAGYESTVNRDGDAFVITNTHTPKTAVSVQKVWNDADDADGLRPGSVTVTLYANSEAYAEAQLSKENGWSYEFANLPKFDVNGDAIIYMPVETPVDGYTSSANREGASVTFTNTHVPDSSLSVQKVWKDEGDANGVRPDKLEVTLYANDQPVKTATLNAEGGWSYIFKDLPRQDGNGAAIRYTVSEGEVEGYEGEISRDGNVFTITNAHTPEETTIDEPDTPKTDNPGDEETTIDEPDTPKASGKKTSDGDHVTVIEESETPLGAPKTGDDAGFGLLVMLMLAACAAGSALITVGGLGRRRRRQS